MLAALVVLVVLVCLVAMEVLVALLLLELIYLPMVEAVGLVVIVVSNIAVVLEVEAAAQEVFLQLPFAMVVFQAVHFLAALLGLTTWELAGARVPQVALAMPSGAALEAVVLFLQILAEEVKVLFMAVLVAAVAVLVLAVQAIMARMEEVTVILEVVVQPVTVLPV